MIITTTLTKTTKFDLLRAQLSVLMVKNVIGYGSNYERVQQIIKEKYDVEYSTQDIEAELFDMKYQDDLDIKANEIMEDEEDFFPGY